MVQSRRRLAGFAGPWIGYVVIVVVPRSPERAGKAIGLTVVVETEGGSWRASLCGPTSELTGGAKRKDELRRTKDETRSDLEWLRYVHRSLPLPYRTGCQQPIHPSTFIFALQPLRSLRLLGAVAVRTLAIWKGNYLLLAAASASISILSSETFGTSFPLTITAVIVFVLLMFSSGLASSNSRSAFFPFSTVPTMSIKPR